jgi:hypothetical protein
MAGKEISDPDRKLAVAFARGLLFAKLLKSDDDYERGKKDGYDEARAFYFLPSWAFFPIFGISLVVGYLLGMGVI